MVLSFTALQDSGVNISVHEIQDNNKTTELRLASERYSVRSPLVRLLICSCTVHVAQTVHVAERFYKTHRLAFRLLCRWVLLDIL